MSVVYRIRMFLLFAAWQFNKDALWKCDVSLAEKATLDRLVLCWSSLVDQHPKYAGDQKCWSMKQGNVLYYSKFCKIMRCKIDVSGISFSFLFVTLNSVCCAEYICDNLMESSHLWCAKTLSHFWVAKINDQRKGRRYRDRWTWTCHVTANQ